jgi:HSP20 family protein
MRITPYNDPFAGLSGLHSQLDDMFNTFFSSPVVRSLNNNLNAMDVYTEDDNQLVAEVQAPGFNKDDIQVHVTNEGVLEIKGEKHETVEDADKKRSYMMRESNASFYRRIALPKNADGGNVQATFDNGVLKVTVPFKELPQPKRVQISTGQKETKK